MTIPRYPVHIFDQYEVIPSQTNAFGVHTEWKVRKLVVGGYQEFGTFDNEARAMEVAIALSKT